jgi:ribosomal protein S18 acetylase RimI-like enzyme
MRPTTPEHIERGLVCLVGGPVPADPERARQLAAGVHVPVERFLAYAREIGLGPERQVQAGDATHTVAGMCLWVPSPGRTAMLFTPPMHDFPDAAAASTACVKAALADAAATGITLVQALLDPEDTAGRAMFAAAGLGVLTTLEYMERHATLLPPPAPSDRDLPPGFRLQAYRPELEGLFVDAILASYQQTLDCPALSGLRDITDVIAGHKAVGDFDPNLWFLLTEHERPVGCLLLARVPARSAMDLVYLGLGPAARGRGLGRLLLQRLLYEMYRHGMATASLSVDEINIPARKLYRRFGFTTVARRLAMITILNKSIC